MTDEEITALLPESLADRESAGEITISVRGGTVEKGPIVDLTLKLLSGEIYLTLGPEEAREFGHQLFEASGEHDPDFGYVRGEEDGVDQ